MKRSFIHLLTAFSCHASISSASFMPIMVGIGSSRVPIGTRNSLRHNHYPLAFQTSSNKHQTSSTTSSTSSSMVAKDFTAAAVGFFGGVRIPASLVAGASIGQLFSLKKETMDISSKPVTERILIQMYNIFILASFLFSMCSIVVSTAANVSILYGGFNPLAETGYELLKREFPLEFIGTRFCFLTSLMSFLVAVTSRIIFEFRLYEKERRDGGLAVILSMATLVSCLLSYVNTTLYCWPNLPRMGIYIMKMLLHRAKTVRQPLMTIAMLSQFLAVFFCSRYVWKSVNSN